MEENIETEIISPSLSDLDSLSTEELIKLFYENWDGSKTSFANQYNINRGNFSSWLKGIKVSPVSERCVKLYLSNKNQTIEKQEKRHPYYNKLKVNPSHVLEKISELKNIKKIIFVDVDNLIGYLSKDFSSIDETSNTHVILFISHQTISAHVTVELSKPWYSLMRAHTCAKNAADTLMSSTVSALCLTIDINVSFVLISYDGFIGELKEIVHSFNPKRKCLSGTPDNVSEILKNM